MFTPAPQKNNLFCIPRASFLSALFCFWFSFFPIFGPRPSENLNLFIL